MDAVPDSSSSLKFRRKERISLDREIEKIIRDGRNFSNDFFILSWMEQFEKDHQPLRRMAIRAGRKVGNAVVRNRAKRIVREIFRHEKKNIRPRTDMVFTIRAARDLKELNYSSVREHFVSVCRKSGIWMEQ